MTKRSNTFITLIFALLIVACNDGNLGVETIRFDNSDVLSCKSDTTATFLFKYNAQQALILELPKDVLENKEKSVTGKIASDYKMYYRTFSEAVNTSYFCADYPPTMPSVVSQFQATGGNISIVTKPIYNETTQELLRYDHLITITDLVILNADGNKIVDSDFIFGTYKTKRE
ncbi:hypothetical protein [Capnocytophaga sp.]|uniref:hypothetical protein n=1 Tax=Capnocytophaga sp. TaxID=44737 RepID=UPI0026DA9A47|nr:hypothetical protein [Capnocytophaga sp.]MDO5105380.1 hypothetical protein [Capnocytophaga sp.]